MFRGVATLVDIALSMKRVQPKDVGKRLYCTLTHSLAPPSLWGLQVRLGTRIRLEKGGNSHSTPKCFGPCLCYLNKKRQAFGLPFLKI